MAQERLNALSLLAIEGDLKKIWIVKILLMLLQSRNQEESISYNFGLFSLQLITLRF